MKSIKVRYFALFREQANCESEVLKVDCHTYEDLYLYLSQKHGFDLAPEILQVAANDEFCALKRELKDGDTVVFIPPVAGG